MIRVFTMRVCTVIGLIAMRMCSMNGPSNGRELFGAAVGTNTKS